MSRLALKLGWRFYRARQSNGFIGFISFASTAGIALGVAVLIILLSAMNGFQYELENRLLGVIPHAEIIGAETPIENWKAIADSAQKINGIEAAAPFMKFEGLIQKNKGFQGINIVGIDTKLEPKVSKLPQFVSQHDWQTIAKGEGNHIIVGHNLLKKLELKIGDTVSMYMLNDSKHSASLNKAKSQRFIISGTYKLGGELEATTAYIPLSYAQKLLNAGDGVTGVRLKMNDVFAARYLVREFGYTLNQIVYMTDWTRTQGHIYQDIQLVRMVMYLALALVIAVACFNVVSTLVMSVRDKQSEIAILMTMGIKRKAMMQTFIFQGMLNGIVGCFLGVAIGVAVALNLSDIAQFFEHLFHFKILSGDVYFIDFLPSKLQWNDVYLSLVIALVLSFISTIYPAWQATKVEPSRALSGT
ncbi:lipoprotein-releasing system transmembrane subunit LolE [Shewanella sp. OPT22]|nr:lipoprotein-releasing system transmembrane subunit LolE [Shewanella sp. OPT22]